MLDVTIDRFAIRIGPRFAVSFQRTLRIPDDGQAYPLPPGLGAFPVLGVDDHASRVPASWRTADAALIAMYQREALWLGFRGAPWKPNAVKIAVGRINVVSGAAFDDVLSDDPQDYVVVPEQPWLDGINTGRGSVRQFVAMPLGFGYTVEASLTGAEEYGGIQIMVFEPKPGRFPETPPPEVHEGPEKMSAPGLAGRRVQTMGLGAGGTMRQKIYPDPYGIDTWDQRNYGRVDVHILNSAQYRRVTGRHPSAPPIDAATYTEHGLPWFDLYDEQRQDVAPSDRLTETRTVAQCDADGDRISEGQESFDVPETQITKLPRGNSGPPNRFGPTR
jgi:hypothetical protein